MWEGSLQLSFTNIKYEEDQIRGSHDSGIIPGDHSDDQGSSVLQSEKSKIEAMKGIHDS